MASNDVDNNLALFCDFENVALGVRDAKMPSFDMKLVLERLHRGEEGLLRLVTL